MTRRCFISIELPASYAEKLFECAVKFRKLHQEHGVKFVRKENFHVTLHFLGNLGEEEILLVKKIIHVRVEKLKKFELFFEGISAFPSLVSPRILFIRGNGDLGPLIQFQEGTGKDLLLRGMSVDSRPWVCHMTIARMFGQRKIDISGLDVPNDKIMVDEISLMESTLSPGGPLYRKISGFPLK